MIPLQASKLWNPSSGGRIYNAVGYVMDALQSIYDNTTGEIQYKIGIMQDTYIPLMLHMGAYGTSDEYLCEDTGSGAPIEALIPKVSFHEGLLPDHVCDLMKCF